VAIPWHVSVRSGSDAAIRFRSASDCRVAIARRNHKELGTPSPTKLRTAASPACPNLNLSALVAGYGEMHGKRRVLDTCMGNSSYEASVTPYLHCRMRPNLGAAQREGHLVVIALNLRGVVKNLPRGVQAVKLICRHHYLRLSKIGTTLVIATSSVL
jgi:hypothetical protein